MAEHDGSRGYAWMGIDKHVPATYKWRQEALKHLASKFNASDREAIEKGDVPTAPETGRWIDHAFTWDQQPQGREFWASLSSVLRKGESLDGVPPPLRPETSTSVYVNAVPVESKRELRIGFNVVNRSMVSTAMVLVLPTTARTHSIDDVVKALQDAIDWLERAKYQTEYRS